MFWRSYLLIDRNCPISFDWKYFLSNLMFISVLVALSYWYIGPRFVLQDSLRYSNL